MISSWWRRRQRDADLDAELQSHLEMSARDHAARGAAPGEARVAARRELGNLSRVREDTRATWSGQWLEKLARDIRYSARSLRRNLVVSVVVVLSLGIGIGATLSVYGLIDALILRPLPVQQPSQLFYIKRDEPLVRSYPIPSAPDFVRYQQMPDVFSGVAGMLDLDLAVGAAPSESEVQRVTATSGNAFDVLGARVVTGRSLHAADDAAPGANAVVVVSSGYAERHLGGSAAALGKLLFVNGRAFVVVGVADPRFTGDWVAGRPTEVWAPFAMLEALNGTSPAAGFSVGRVVARLQSGVSTAQAQAALDVVAPQLAQENLAASPGLPDALVRTLKLRVVIASAERGYSPQREHFAPALGVLLLLAGMVLLITCANVAALLLSRGVARQREMSVRVALGAGRAQIFRQLLAESATMIAVGTALALVFYLWATAAVLGFVAGGGAVPGPGEMRALSLRVGLNARVLAVSAGLALAIAALFATLPALQTWRGRLAGSLTLRGTAAGAERVALGKGLVVTQVAVSLLLLVVAGLFTRTLQDLRGQNLGYDRSHLLIVATTPARTGHSPTQIVGDVETIAQRLGQLPGVKGAAFAGGIGVMSGLDAYGGSDAIRVANAPSRPGLRIVRTAVSAGFFEATGIRRIAGRDFASWDRDSALRVVIVNETLARFLFGKESALGRRIGILSDSGTPREIVGVVGDAKYNTPRDGPMGALYLPYRQRPSELALTNFLVRTDGDPRGLSEVVRRTVSDVQPGLPISSVRTFDAQLDDTLSTERLIASLARFFGVLAALLASLGLYGVISFRVTRQINEIGVRIALGATRAGVVRKVLAESAVLVAVGLPIGLVGYWAVEGLIASQLFGVTPTDPITIGGAMALLTLLAMLGAAVPARRAATVDPVVALRQE